MVLKAQEMRRIYAITVTFAFAYIIYGTFFGSYVHDEMGLTEGSVVIQLEDGSLNAFSPEEAREHLAAMSPKARALYENIT